MPYQDLQQLVISRLLKLILQLILGNLLKIPLGLSQDGWAIDLFFIEQFTVLVGVKIALIFIVKLEATPSKKQAVIVKKIWKAMCIFGPPKYLLSDNGGKL
jgi:hypothetical protein